ncbi:hypothetical protein CBR_g30550 [Chara braunii]|uniref:DUF7869 domain-containing protein n=1 Tax=Chara braunii TaxID=69332 RepID=A0A388LD07_CHABU|nr:hypothetical protein CBR_g30550 [Chara braunii]|eukprot:GBG80184.1 hypothetical protein CBR_g30550 [Chara braunii]
MMKTILTSIIAHGRNPSLIVHTWFSYLSHGSNSVVTSIAKVLRDVQAREGKLPPLLRVQADNCGGQNKNRFIFAFLALLVKFRIFKEILMGFMIVGHTHTDIDAKFSLFARKLNGSDVYTMEELFAVLQQSCEEQVECTQLMEMVDWKTTISPYLDNLISGHATPHLFCFYMEDDNPAMLYKAHCTDKNWGPEKGPVYWFKRSADKKWAGPEWGFEPRRESPDPASGDFTNGKAGLRVLVKTWKDAMNEWETQTIEERQLKTSRLRYWTERLTEFDNIEVEETRTVSLSFSFWPKPMPSDPSSEHSVPCILPQPFRKPCFVGHRKDAPKPEFDPYKAVELDDFVVLRAPDDHVQEGCIFWVARVIKKETTRIFVEYWRPCGRKQKLSKLYEDAWNKTWRVETESEPGWQDLRSVAWAWTSGIRSRTGMKIRKGDVVKAQKSLAAPDPVDAAFKNSHDLDA